MWKYRSKNQMSNRSSMGFLLFFIFFFYYSLLFDASLGDVVGSDSVAFRLLFKEKNMKYFCSSQKDTNF